MSLADSINALTSAVLEIPEDNTADAWISAHLPLRTLYDAVHQRFGKYINPLFAVTFKEATANNVHCGTEDFLKGRAKAFAAIHGLDEDKTVALVLNMNAGVKRNGYKIKFLEPSM